MDKSSYRKIIIPGAVLLQLFLTCTSSRGWVVVVEAWVTVGVSSGIVPQQRGCLSRCCSDHRLTRTTTNGYCHKDRDTRLYVSELHIPAYAQSKLPFLYTPPPSPENDGVPYQNYDRPQQSQHSMTTTTTAECMIPFQDGYLIHKTTNAPILSTTECNAIVQEAEDIATQIAWTTNRHGNYPTTDLPLIELPQTLTFLRRVLHERIYPTLREQYRFCLPDPYKLRVVDGFVVKYDANGGQTSLREHRDGSVLSFNIALNPSHEYSGGGTWFASLNDAVTLQQGEMISHASALLHGGHGITSGKRYILVAFVIVEGYDSWSMRFYNQVRNL